MNRDELIQDLKIRVKNMERAQAELHGELLAMEGWLDRSLDDVSRVNVKLKELRAKKDAAEALAETPVRAAPEQPLPVVERAPQLNAEDFTAQMEKMLQGSLDALGDKISGKLLAMMKELKSTTGPMREEKIREIKEAADAELVDLSRLFAYDKVDSNIEDIGIKEKEAKGIETSLEKLRRMKKGIKE